MVTHSDAVLNRALRKLGRAESLGGKVTFSEGNGTTKQVAHVLVTYTVTFTIPRIEFFGTEGGVQQFTSVIEVYLSRSGITLLQLGESLSAGSNVIILAELEDPDEPDLTSGQVFQVVRRNGYEVGQFRSETQFLTPALASILGVRRSDYDDIVEAAFDTSSVLRFFTANDISLAVVTLLVDNLKPPIDAFAKLLATGTMPEELWNPDRMPEDFTKLIASLGAQLDAAAEAVLDFLASLPTLAIADEIRSWPGSSLISGVVNLIASLEGMWNSAVTSMREIVEFIRDAIPDAKDMISTLIGYLCGLWDAIMQAAAGIFETASLALTLLKEAVAASQDPLAAGRFLLEALDEFIQILSRVDWAKLWRQLRDDIYPLLVDLLKASAESLADTVARSPATVGYYAGFTVYTVAEIFFPPLKINGLSKAIRAADQTSAFVGKVVT